MERGEREGGKREAVKGGRETWGLPAPCPGYPNDIGWWGCATCQGHDASEGLFLLVYMEEGKELQGETPTLITLFLEFYSTILLLPVSICPQVVRFRFSALSFLPAEIINPLKENEDHVSSALSTGWIEPND